MESVEERKDGSDVLATGLALVQGSYDVVTGVWPLVHLRSFEAVTGPKPEGWLVKTVGVLVAAIGSTLLVAGLRRRVSPELMLLAAGSAAGLAAVNVVYASRRRIAPVYLLDAVAEGALVAGWGVAAWRHRRQRPSFPSPLRTGGRHPQGDVLRPAPGIILGEEERPEGTT